VGLSQCATPRIGPTSHRVIGAPRHRRGRGRGEMLWSSSSSSRRGDQPPSSSTLCGSRSLSISRCRSSAQGFSPDRSVRSTAVLIRYTGPVQPGTTQNRMNSNSKSKFLVQSVWSGISTSIPVRFDRFPVIKPKNLISGEFDIFSNLN
jgi:hypothetical protein